MTRLIRHPSHQDVYEYHGHTAILQTRKRGGQTVWQQWLLFDSVEEASDFFNINCCMGEG